MERDDTGYSNSSTYRPVVDQDIINDNGGPNNIGTGGVLPNESGTRNSVMPNRDDVTNPVMPPDRNTTTSQVENVGEINKSLVEDMAIKSRVFFLV